MESSSLLSKFFSKWFFALLLLLVLSGILLFLRIPDSLYQSMLEFVSGLLKQKYGSGGSIVKIDKGFHKLAVLLIAMGIALLGYFSFWKRFISSFESSKLKVNQQLSLPKLGKNDWMIIVSITLIAMLLRVFPLTQSLWQDEIGVYNTFIKNGFLSTLFPKNSMGSQPLMQLIVGLFAKILGSSEVALRMPIFLIGVASIFLIYYFTLALTKNRLAAGLSAFLLCVHSYHIYYSFQMRGYAILVFLCLISCYLLYRLIEFPSKKYGIYYCLISIAIVFTHLYAVYLLFAQHFIIILFQLHSKYIKKEVTPIFSSAFLVRYFESFLIAMLCSVMLYVPQLPVIFMNILDTVNGIKSLSVYFRSVLDAMNYMIAYSPYQWISFSFLILVLLLFIFRIEKPFAIKLVSAIALALFIITAFVPSGSGFFPRYLICEIPLLVFLLATSIAQLWDSTNKVNKAVSIALFAGFVLLNSSGYELTYQKIQDYKGAVAYVKNSAATKPQLIVSNSLGKTEVQHYDKNIVALNNVQELDSLMQLDYDLFAITTYESFVGRSVFVNDKATQERIVQTFEHEKTFPGEFPVNVWHYQKK